MLWQWVYNARSAGIDLAIDVDYEDTEVTPAPEPASAAPPGGP